MSRFLGPLDLRLVGAGRWMTLASFAYESDLAAQRLSVPARFITDLSSVPRVAFAYLLAGGRAPGPAVIHDYLYQHPDWEDRALADEVFHEAMGVSQPELGLTAESRLIRSLMWAGVRAGGWLPWQQHGKRAARLNPLWTRTGWPEGP